MRLVEKPEVDRDPRTPTRLPPQGSLMLKVLSLYDFTGVMVAPWLEIADCTIVDLLHPEGITEATSSSPRKIGVNMLEWGADDAYDVVFAFPPCTDLAVTGNRWFHHPDRKGRIKTQADIDAGMALVGAARRIISECRPDYWFLENPISKIATLWRKPDYYFHPYEFGGYLDPPSEGYTKRTCLWRNEGWPELAKKFVPVLKELYLRDLPPSKRKAIREKTPAGFAQAVFEALSPRLLKYKGGVR